MHDQRHNENAPFINLNKVIIILTIYILQAFDSYEGLEAESSSFVSNLHGNDMIPL